jgi:hypothetical protein
MVLKTKPHAQPYQVQTPYRQGLRHLGSQGTKTWGEIVFEP